MARLCRHSNGQVALVLVLLIAVVAAVAGLGFIGALLALAYFVAAGMIASLLVVASRRDGY